MMKNSENIVKYNYTDTMEYHFMGRGYLQNYTPSLHRAGICIFPGGIFGD